MVCRWNMMIDVWIFVVAAFAVATAFDGDWTIAIEHSIGDSGIYTALGTVTLQFDATANVTGKLHLAPDTSVDMKRQLLSAAVDNQLYRVRSGDVSSFTNPVSCAPDTSTLNWDYFECLLLRSGLDQLMVVAIDSARRQLLSISILPYTTDDGVPCTEESDLRSVTKNAFNTTLMISDVRDGPSPETQAYIQKVEKERISRQHGAQQDNRSFIAKYWMYIVPVVLFFMVSSAMNNEPQAAAA